jgi:ferritin
MKISEALNETISYQCDHELMNMIKYKMVATYFEQLKLKNLSKKFYNQANEEYQHYTEMTEYLNSRGGKYIPTSVSAPVLDISTPREAGDIYYKLETDTTESLQSIAEMIYEEKSYIDVAFIEKYLAIQIIEEDEADTFRNGVQSVNDIVLFDATIEV